MELQQIVHSVDVRIHHRIWDAQKHLFQTLDQTLDKANQKFIESIVISLTIQYNVKNISNMNCIQLGIH